MDLKAFVDLLEREGLLARIERPVSVEYEVGALIQQLAGRPVLFQDVKGHDLPVVANVCATREVLGLALGVPRQDLIRHLAHAVEHPLEPEVVSAEGYEEIDPDLGRLPIATYTLRDGGPYIASGVVVARDPEHGSNVSFHRSMVTGPRTLTLRIVERHLHAYIERGLREFALCIGNSPSVLVAGAVSVELGRSELAIANALAETRLVDLEGHLVPESQVVLLCRFTDETADEGPFLDLTETFDFVRKQPVARVEKIYLRRGALFHVLLPADLEHKLLMGFPREPTIYREVSRVCECLDVRLTPGGCCWLHGAVRIRKRDEGDGRKAIEAAFRGHSSMKHVFVVDEDVDIDDPAALEWALATRFQGDRDLVLKPGEKGSSLDPSSDPDTKITTKIGFDLTAPLAGADAFRRAAPASDVRLEDYL